MTLLGAGCVFQRYGSTPQAALSAITLAGFSHSQQFVRRNKTQLSEFALTPNCCAGLVFSIINAEELPSLFDHAQCAGSQWLHSKAFKQQGQVQEDPFGGLGQ